MLFSVLYKKVTFLLPSLLKGGHSMKSTERYFTVVLFITLFKVVLIFESEDEILKCSNHSNKSY